MKQFVRQRVFTAQFHNDSNTHQSVLLFIFLPLFFFHKNTIHPSSVDTRSNPNTHLPLIFFCVCSLLLGLCERVCVCAW